MIQGKWVGSEFGINLTANFTWKGTFSCSGYRGINRRHIAGVNRVYTSAILYAIMMLQWSTGTTSNPEATTGEFATLNQHSSEVLSERESRRSALMQKFSPKLIKNILELLCDESVRITFLFQNVLHFLYQFLTTKKCIIYLYLNLDKIVFPLYWL